MNYTCFLVCLLPFALCCGTAEGKEFFVAPNGNNSQAGTLAEPFQTVQHAFDASAPGDSIRLRKGVYREEVLLRQKSGEEGKPITLSGYRGEEAVLSGLDECTLTWRPTGKPGIYVADYKDAAFEQMFYQGKPMLEARWPNVPLTLNGDWNFFSPKMWADVDPEGNSYGSIADSDLAKTGWNVTGARAVLNVAHQYYTWSRVVEGHATGSHIFHYTKDLGKSVDIHVSETGKESTWNDDRYYLLGKIEFLDAPGEWVLDKEKQLLYFYPPDGKVPNSQPLEIKKRTYSLKADKSSNYLTLDGITFWGTAFYFGDKTNARSCFVTVKNCQILHSSWTEYFNLPKGDPLEKLEDGYPAIYADNFTVSNNTFAYGALSGLLIHGFDNTIENNTFHDLNYNSSLRRPPLVAGVNWPSNNGTGGRAIVRTNTIFRSGGILLQTGLQDNKVYLNHCYDAFLSCWGGNKDTSAFYASGKLAAGTRVTHNWIHNAYCDTIMYPWGGGIGIRGDDDTVGLTVDHNLVWNTGSVGIHVKNVHHPESDQGNRVIHNTVFSNCRQNKPGQSIIIQSKAEDENAQSLASNNLSEALAGFWKNQPLGKLKAVSANFSHANAATLLENVSWFDFRPLSGARGIVDEGIPVPELSGPSVGKGRDIGAYERGDQKYWIPGRREAKASFPIVPDGAMEVPLNRDALMWRPAYQAVSHAIYFETSEPRLEQSPPKGTFTDTQNVALLPRLAPNQSYFWRVDATLPDGTVSRGDVWKFTTSAKGSLPSRLNTLAPAALQRPSNK
jgi:hypothetical protein